MKSTIRIEIDFDTKEPIIEIVCDTTSDDLRDKMLHHFLQEFRGCSSWAKFNFASHYTPDKQRAFLRPITNSQFHVEGMSMLEQYRLNRDNQMIGTAVFPEGDTQGEMLNKVLHLLEAYRPPLATTNTK